MASDEIKACFVFNTGVRSTLIDPERVEIFRNGVAWPRRGHPPINVVVTYTLKTAPEEVKEVRGVVAQTTWEAGQLTTIRVTNDDLRCTFHQYPRGAIDLYGMRTTGIDSESIPSIALQGNVVISLV